LLFAQPHPHCQLPQQRLLGLCVGARQNCLHLRHHALNIISRLCWLLCILAKLKLLQLSQHRKPFGFSLDKSGSRTGSPTLLSQIEHNSYRLFDAGQTAPCVFDAVLVVERQSGSVWNQLRYFIITPNQGMEERVREVLDGLAVDQDDVFTERIPSNVQIGLDADADDFLTAVRYSMPVDGGGTGTPSDRWRRNPTMRVLRVRDAEAGQPGEPYPAWEDDSPEERTAEPEAYLSADLAALVFKVSETRGQVCDDPECSTRAGHFIDAQSFPINLVGPLCDNIGMNCLGDAQDASYQFRPGLGLDDGEVYAVVGTLGTATGNATYVSLGVNQFRLRLGCINVDGTQLEDSATPEFCPGAGHLDKLFVYYFTRDCQGLEDLTHGFCASIEATDLVIPYGYKATFVERDYIKVGTQRGPDSTLLLPSIVLALQRPAP
jgi:hypothetical protein